MAENSFNKVDGRKGLGRKNYFSGRKQKTYSLTIWLPAPGRVLEGSPSKRAKRRLSRPEIAQRAIEAKVIFPLKISAHIYA